MINEILARARNFDFSQLKIAVVYGGETEESQVSLMSIGIIQEKIAEITNNYELIDFDENIVENLKKSSPDMVFNGMYGKYGEDGCLPAVCKILGIKFTHSDVLASSVLIDKNFAKQLFLKHNLSIIDSIFCKKSEINAEFIKKAMEKLKTDKVVIKPNDSGSSVGVSIVSKENMDFSESKKSASGNFLIEKYVPGDDFCVPVLLGKAMGILQLHPISGFYDYDNKYNDGKTEHIWPAKLPAKIYDEMLKAAEAVYSMADCSTLARIDFRYNENSQQFFITEGNSNPGLTKNSIVPEVLGYNGITYTDLLKIFLYEGIQRE